MPHTDQSLEQAIQAKGLTAPRITPDRIEALLASVTVQVHHFPGTTTMVAMAFLPNGFSVGLGKSACASPDNFDEEIGTRIAYDNAIKDARQRLWELEGYALKQQLAGAM